MSAFYVATEEYIQVFINWERLDITISQKYCGIRPIFHHQRKS